jgi:hypothetical protein
VPLLLEAAQYGNWVEAERLVETRGKVLGQSGRADCSWLGSGGMQNEGETG